MKIAVLGVVALGVLTGACGTDTQERAATGGLTGLGAGAVVGAVGGWAAPEGADQLALNAFGQEHRLASGAPEDAGLGPQAQGGDGTVLVREAQVELEHQGFYSGPVNGVHGPETQRALSAYQKHAGLQQTARLDPETLQRLDLPASGNSTPPAALGVDAIRDKLRQDGYTNVTELRWQSNDTDTARADRGGDSYRLRIDAQTGHVISDQRVVANEGADDGSSAGPEPGSGTSTSTGSRNP
jgi:peptidoglycan hydrolase-like protein with peptidoglycan-binding domain